MLRHAASYGRRMGRGATSISDGDSLLSPRGQDAADVPGDLADDLRETLESSVGMRVYHALAWLLLEAEARGYDGLRAAEISSVFERIDPGLYGRSERIRYQHLLSDAKKMDLATVERFGSSEARWHPTLYAREYLGT